MKRKIENVLMYPFILLGRLLAKLDPLPKEYDIYFFFPFYHTGGAEKVHSLIAKAAGDNNCIIFFTRKSVDDTFLDDFRKTGSTIQDISPYIDNILLYPLKFIWRGKISGYINHQRSAPVIFNGQSNFGYKISPWIRKGIKQVELIHSFNSFSWIRIPFLPFIDETVMISRRRIDEHLAQYTQLNIPDAYADKIRFIQNAIELPAQPCDKHFHSPLDILFVGRGTPEKRPELFITIARALPQHRFTMAGEMPADVISSLPKNVTALGNVNDTDRLHDIYCRHQVIIIPSETEGFPIVLMEAMARGCAVMATPVGDIPYHIDNSVGYLFSSIEKDRVITEAVNRIHEWTHADLQALSVNAQDHAFKNFGIDRFNQQYKAILQR